MSDDHQVEKIVAKSEKFDNTKYWIEHGIDIENRRIMLDEDVNEHSVGWVIRAMLRMIDANKTEPIDIYVNSYGGYCYDGFALYDFIRACSYTTIRTHASGKIMSMGLSIYLAGDERYSSPRSTFMAHSVSGGTAGKLYEITTDTRETKRLHDNNLDILEDRTKKTLAWWKKEIQYEDQYYDKKKALTLGIVTHDKFEVEGLK